jgi:hypothetical protein
MVSNYCWRSRRHVGDRPNRTAARERLSQGLEKAENVTRESRQALRKTEETLGHTQRTIEGIWGAVKP